jgi:hypothetical protein
LIGVASEHSGEQIAAIAIDSGFVYYEMQTI